MTVNPLIIERKNSYIKSLEIMQSGEGIDAYNKELDTYYDISEKFVAAQKNWIDVQKEFLARRDVRLLTPKIMLKAGDAQIAFREAEMQSSLVTMKMFYSGDQTQGPKSLDKINALNKIQEQKENEYIQLLEERDALFDPRNFFIKVPPSICPPENFDIPDTNTKLQELFREKKVEYSPLS